MTTYLGEEPWGAVSIWTLNNTAADAKGANNGTANNVTYTLDSSSKWSYRGVFGGSNSWVDIPDNASLRVSHFTLCAWFKGTLSAQGCVLSNWVQTGGKYYGWAWEILATGKLKLLVAKGTGTVAGTDYVDAQGSKFTVDDNVWHHIAVTYDGSNVRHYADGVLDTTTSWANVPVYTTTQYPSLGVRQETSGLWYDYIAGSLDNVCIYNIDMDPGTIKRIYANATGRLQ